MNLPPATSAPLIDLAVNTVSSLNSRRAYARALLTFSKYCVASGHSFTKVAVVDWKAQLETWHASPAYINLQLSAIRRLAEEAADANLIPQEVASQIRRIRGVAQHGTRTGNWLTRDQAEALINSPDPTTPKGKRDRALLGVLIGAGLRREEAARLQWDDIQLRDGRWVIVDLVGKGQRTRTVPIPAWTKVLLDEWRKHVEALEENQERTTERRTESAPSHESETEAKTPSDLRSTNGGHGVVCRGSLNDLSVATRLETNVREATPFVFQSITKGRQIGRTLTPTAIYQTVQHYAARQNLKIAPHDLRRTFAKLAHKGRAQLEQIQLSLGHASIQTTERYLGVRQDLTDAPCDHLEISIER